MFTTPSAWLSVLVVDHVVSSRNRRQVVAAVTTLVQPGFTVSHCVLADASCGTLYLPNPHLHTLTLLEALTQLVLLVTIISIGL